VFAGNRFIAGDAAIVARHNVLFFPGTVVIVCYPAVSVVENISIGRFRTYLADTMTKLSL
jgi:hypothetical protein